MQPQSLTTKERFITPLLQIIAIVLFISIMLYLKNTFIGVIFEQILFLLVMIGCLILMFIESGVYLFLISVLVYCGFKDGVKGTKNLISHKS